MDAYLAGLEKALDAGLDLSKIHSVASFFVSRVDTEIDNRLNKTGASDDLLGKAGVANARLAYEAYEKFFSGDRWDKLAAAGANRQRPLWASTGVKNPDYKDTMYVDDLVVENTVNTMPEKTLLAVNDHGEIIGDQVRPELRRRPRGDEVPGRRRHRLRRRDRHPRAGGRRQVRQGVERAPGHREDEPRRCPRRGGAQ